MIASLSKGFLDLKNYFGEGCYYLQFNPQLLQNSYFTGGFTGGCLNVNSFVFGILRWVKKTEAMVGMRVLITGAVKCSAKIRANARRKKAIHPTAEYINSTS